VFAPTVPHRIVGFVGIGIFAVRADTADGVDLVINNSERQGAAGGGHVGFYRPAVGGRIIFINRVNRSDTGDIAADSVDFAGPRDGADMVQQLRQRGAPAPTVFGRIVFFDQVTTFAVAAEEEYFAAQFDGRDFRARRRQWGAALPFTG
jgi:hypothetical protein